MNIGDKVRLIHSKEEGIVTRILPNNVIEIEIEDGFRLPVLKRESVSYTHLDVYKRQRVGDAPNWPRRKKSKQDFLGRGCLLSWSF